MRIESLTGRKERRVDGVTFGGEDLLVVGIRGDRSSGHDHHTLRVGNQRKEERGGQRRVFSPRTSFRLPFSLQPRFESSREEKEERNSPLRTASRIP